MSEALTMSGCILDLQGQLDTADAEIKRLREVIAKAIKALEPYDEDLPAYDILKEANG